MKEQDNPNFLPDAIIRDIEDFEAELGRRIPETSSVINPDLGIGSGDVVNSRHKEVVKPRILDRSALTGAEKVQLVDHIAYLSESRMIAGE